jgi:hypothetical protein
MADMREHWTWFLAGGFTGLALARWLARMWWRLFWVAAAAVFALGTLSLATPGSDSPEVLKAAHRAAWAATRGLVAKVGEAEGR